MYEFNNSSHLVPSSPLSFNLIQLDGEPYQLMASWSPPEFENGNIVAYTVFCRMVYDQDFTFRDTLDSLTLSVNVTDLMPFTSYECHVTANTSAGEGPPSNNATAMTDEDGKSNTEYTCLIIFVVAVDFLFDCLLLYLHFNSISTVPGIVENLNLALINSTHLNVSWEEPSEPNGVITGYNLTYSSVYLPNNNNTLADVITNLTDTQYLLSVTPYTNYTIEVRAETGAGQGAASVSSIMTPEAGNTCLIYVHSAA